MEKIYKCLDVIADQTVTFGTPTKWGYKIHLATATQEQLKYLYEIKHPFIYIYKEQKNGNQD